jgi:hypothetical protein
MINSDRIQPYSPNPRYWAYKGQPVLLLGGSKTDHIFLLDDLEDHLAEIAEVGGNYVRNTMSQREAQELKPHRLLPAGSFDLDRWNEEYWKRFQNMLEWTHERDIVVQIEVWDRFDYSLEPWHLSPWNPANNTNYTSDETGLATEYPRPCWEDVQPFFHTIKGMDQYRPKYERVRIYQEEFVAKLLCYSLKYRHVLYCMNNETSTSPTWGQYWIQFIQPRAAKKGVNVYTTDMFDDTWKAKESVLTPIIFENPQIYQFVDISQVNSRVFGEHHWENMQWLVNQVHKHPRPVNHTKIYGSGYTSWGSGGPEDGIERFWRNILGGCASARFHRDGGGIGLQPMAKACIRAARKLESLIKLWDVTPHMGLLSDRNWDEAYLAANPGEQYALYFPDGGSIGLDLTGHKELFELRWINVCTGDWGEKAPVPGDGIVTISAPDKGGWIAAIVRSPS